MIGYIDHCLTYTMNVHYFEHSKILHFLAWVNLYTLYIKGERSHAIRMRRFAIAIFYGASFFIGRCTLTPALLSGSMATFFHLPREDVVFPLIFHELDTVVVWRLRCVCRSLRKLCEDYFETFCPSVVYRECTDYTAGNTRKEKGCDSPNSKYLQDRACVLRPLRVCKRLKRITLCLSSPMSETGSSTTNALQKTTYSLYNSICHLQPGCRLVSLALVNMDCSSDSDGGSGWERLGERCKELKKLRIENIPQFNDVCMKSLTKHCTSLIQLTLKSLPGIQGVYLPRLVETCPLLETINVSIRWT